jgi:hypothetical protein
LAITPDGSRVYVAGWIKGIVFVIDTLPSSSTYNTILETLVLAPQGTEDIEGVAITPDGAHVFVASGSTVGNGTQNVYVIDSSPSSSTYNLVTKIPLTAEGFPPSVNITPDGTRAYVGGLINPTIAGGWGFSVINTANNSVVSAPLGPACEATSIAFTPDGTRGYAPGGQEVCVVDTAPSSSTYNTLVATVAFGGAPNGVAIGACPDADGDGLCDSWETNGVDVQTPSGPVFVDLHAMGANPKHKDIFVQTDYMVASDHTHKPDLSAIAAIVQAFANAPVANPDGSTGIALHVDCGSDCVMNPSNGTLWGSLSKANSLSHSPTLGAAAACNNCLYDWTNFLDLKSAHFPPERASIFHYAIFAHDLSFPDPAISGISRLPSTGMSDFIVSLGEWKDHVGSVWEQAGTFMHELGHNLNLHHGGNDDLDYKPNYLSIMNHLFQMSGLSILQPTTSNIVPGSFDYSRFSGSVIPPLNEASLDESVGLNGGPVLQTYGTAYWGFGPSCLNSQLNPPMTTPVTVVNGSIDWNCDGRIESTVAAEINLDSQLETLNSFNDWCAKEPLPCQLTNVVFRGGAIGALGVSSTSPPTTVSPTEITASQDAVITKTFSVVVAGGGILSVTPGGTATLSYTIMNRGISTDTYNIAAASTAGFADLSNVPSTISLDAGASAHISISVSVPPSAANGILTDVSVTATSQTGSTVMDRADTQITVNAGTIRPTTTPTVSPQPNAAGWNNTTANINLASVETGGSVAQITYSASGAQAIPSTVVPGTQASITINTEGSTIISYFGTDNAGNSEAPKTLTIQLDKTPPTIMGTRVPAANAQGWNDTSVSVSFSCADTLSGLAGSPPPSTLVSSQGASQSVSGTCQDMAGNSSTATVAAINIDTTPPTITVVTPLKGATYTANQDVFASYSCSDSLSGIASCAGSVPNNVKLDTSSGGAKTFVVNAIDLAGNSVSQTVNYSVISPCQYVTLGFKYTTVTRGSTDVFTGTVSSCTTTPQNVSLKFSLTGPLGPKACATSTTVMFATPQFTISPGTSKTVSFPFIIPKTACAGSYTVTATTILGGVPIDSSSASLTVK